jgi:hypothetical protein
MEKASFLEITPDQDVDLIRCDGHSHFGVGQITYVTVCRDGALSPNAFGDWVYCRFSEIEASFSCWKEGIGTTRCPASAPTRKLIRVDKSCLKTPSWKSDTKR